MKRRSNRPAVTNLRPFVLPILIPIPFAFAPTHPRSFTYTPNEGVDTQAGGTFGDLRWRDPIAGAQGYQKILVREESRVVLSFVVRVATPKVSRLFGPTAPPPPFAPR